MLPIFKTTSKVLHHGVAPTVTKIKSRLKRDFLFLLGPVLCPQLCADANTGRFKNRTFCAVFFMIKFYKQRVTPILSG